MLNLFISLSKTQIVKSDDVIALLDLLRGYKKIAVVTGKNHFKVSSHYERVYNVLSSLGGEFVIVSEVEPNPTLENIDFCYDILRSFKPEILVGIGGGSVMDATKAIALKLANDGIDVWDCVEGNVIPESALPTFMVPTTSGTGSEVNRYSVITNKVKVQKRALRSQAIYPKYALLIPSMTSDMNKYLTAITAVDALSHAVESLVSKNSNPISESLSEKAIRLILSNIFVAYNNGGDLISRENLQFASTLGGLAIDITGVGLMHAIEHPITARFPHISHGQGLAILFKKVVEHSFMFNVEKYKKVADAFGIKVRGNNDMVVMHTLIDAIDYLITYLGLNKKLSDFGVEKSDLKYIAEDAITYMGRSIASSPYSPSKDSIEKILREVF
jgi:alcohol dehydrogenase class IV